MRSDLIDLEARLVHETDKALLLDFGGDEPVWLPKSTCEFDGTEVTLNRRLAEEKGLV